MNTTLLVFIGAGCGGVFRYWIANGIHLFFGRDFPYGTLIVNVSGSFLMGLLFTFILDKFSNIAPQLQAFFLIGFLGGYTTFSSFSIETWNLFENGAWFSASLNILLSMLLCILLTGLGIWSARQI